DVPSLLLGDGRDAGQRLAVWASRSSGIADHENTWMGRHRKICLYLHAAGTIALGAEPLGHQGGFDTGGPHIASADVVAERDSGAITIHYAGVEANFDAELLQRAPCPCPK